MTTETKPLTGMSLMRRIEATGMIHAGRAGVYDAPTPKEIVDAQKLLLANGYYLSGAAMVESDFYQLHFMRADGEWPGWVKLRYTTHGIQVPVLALMYHEDDEVKQFTGAGYRSTHGTGTSNAEKMVFAFNETHGDFAYFWMPIFKGNPFAQE